MRSAIVVLPVCASVVAGALLGLQLHARPTPPPTVVAVPLPIVERAGAPARSDSHGGHYARPIGGQYLLDNPLLAFDDLPPQLLEPHTGDDAFRYRWRYEALATAMAKELAAVLDDACPQTCWQTAAAREALQTWLDAGGYRENHLLRRWKTGDDAPTYHRKLTVTAAAGRLAVDVSCESSADYIGMRMWNQDTSCEAVLRQHGHVLLTYTPHQLHALDRGTFLHARNEWVQSVSIPDLPAELMTTTGTGESDSLDAWGGRPHAHAAHWFFHPHH